MKVTSGFDKATGLKSTPQRRTPSLQRLTQSAVASMVVLLLTACTSTPEELPATPTRAPVTTSAAAAPTSQPPARDPEIFAQWSKWRPSKPVTDFVPLPETEKLRIREQRMAEDVITFEIEDPPEVPLERWITVDEMYETQGQCLRERGYTVVPSRFGEFATKNTPEEEESLKKYYLDNYICTNRFYLDPDWMQLATDDQALVYYEYFTTVQTPCLEAQGLEVTDTPTLDEFLAIHAAGSLWLPEGSLGEGDPDALQAALSVCPPWPSWAALTGQ